MFKKATILFFSLLLTAAFGVTSETDPQLKKLEDQLEAARKNLRISQATEAKIERDIEALRARGNVDPEVLEDYTLYLARVRGLLAEHAKMVKEMEAVYAKVAPAAPAADSDPGTFDPTIPEQIDELARLERELNASLAKFDDYINAEMAAAAQKMKSLSQENEEERNEIASQAANAVKRLRERGIDVETELPEGGGEGREGEGEGEGEQTGAGTQPAAEGSQPGAEGSQPAAEGSESGSEGEGDETEPGSETEPGTGSNSDSSTDPGTSGSLPGGLPRHPGGLSNDSTTGGGQGGNTEGAGTGSVKGKHNGKINPRRDGSGDDIVARQLREAAEKETDPELKEKLWKEYDDYKKGL